jgi:hypothetical protein
MVESYVGPFSFVVLARPDRGVTRDRRGVASMQFPGGTGGPYSRSVVLSSPNHRHYQAGALTLGSGFYTARGRAVMPLPERPLPRLS